MNPFIYYQVGSISISSLHTLRYEIQIGSLSNQIDCFRRTYCALFNKLRSPFMKFLECNIASALFSLPISTQIREFAHMSIFYV